MKANLHSRPAAATQHPQPPNPKIQNPTQDDPRQRLEILKERLVAQQTLCTMLAAVRVKPGGKTAAQELTSREAARSETLLAIATSQILARLGETAPGPAPALHDAPFSDWSPAARELHTARLTLDSIEQQVITLEHNIELVESGLIDKSRIFDGLSAT